MTDRHSRVNGKTNFSDTTVCNRHKNRRDNLSTVLISAIIKILHRHRSVRWVHTDFQIFYPVELNWGRYYSVKTFAPIPQMYKMPKS